jgi:TolA-binding protein
VREADRWAGDQGEHLLEFGRMALQGNGPDSLSSARAEAGIQALTALGQSHPESNLIPEATQLAAEGLVELGRSLPASENRRALLQQAVEIIDANSPKLRMPQLVNHLLALKGMILLEDLGQPAEALAAFEKVARQQRQLGDSDQLVRVQMALCQAALGRLDEARAGLEEVVKSDSAAAAPSPFPGRRRSDDPQNIGWSRARYYLAEFDLIDGKYEEAQKGFAALAEQSPEDRMANDCLDLALVLNESAGADPALPRFGRYRRAVLLHDAKTARAELESIAREHPQSILAPIALFELGKVLAEGHEAEPALARFQEVLARHPEHRLAPRALEEIGDLQVQALDRPDLAVTSYEKLLLTYPDDLFLDGVRKKLLAARAAAGGGKHATP